MAFNDDYVDVVERIAQFYAKYPDGRLVTKDWKVLQTAEADWVAVEAEAYRTPDDPNPGVGLAWERVPGRTNFTRDSELMNAETSAWGRAIVSLGFKTKHIASANEVRNRQYDDSNTPPPPNTRQQRPSGAPQVALPSVPTVSSAELSRLLAEIGLTDPAEKADAIGWAIDWNPVELNTQGKVTAAVTAWAIREGITEDVALRLVERIKGRER